MWLSSPRSVVSIGNFDLHYDGTIGNNNIYQLGLLVVIAHSNRRSHRIGENLDPVFKNLHKSNWKCQKPILTYSFNRNTHQSSLIWYQPAMMYICRWLLTLMRFICHLCLMQQASVWLMASSLLSNGLRALSA